MISHDPNHQPTALARHILTEAERIVDEPNEARARLAALQLSVAPSRDNLEVLEHALFLEESHLNRPQRIACISQAIRDLEAKLSTKTQN